MHEAHHYTEIEHLPQWPQLFLKLFNELTSNLIGEPSESFMEFRAAVCVTLALAICFVRMFHQLRVTKI